MIVDRDEWNLFKKLSRNRTVWWQKNVITCKKCFYGCCKESSNPHCDYISYEHHSKHCTGLTCIQHGIFKPATERVKVEKVWSKFNEWINRQVECGFTTMGEVRNVFDRWPDPLGHYTELSGGGDSQRSVCGDEERVQTDEVFEEWQKKNKP